YDRAQRESSKTINIPDLLVGAGQRELVPQLHQILCHGVNSVHAWHARVIHSLRKKKKLMSDTFWKQRSGTKSRYSDFISLHVIINLHTPDSSGEAGTPGCSIVGAAREEEAGWKEAAAREEEAGWEDAAAR